MRKKVATLTALFVYFFCNAQHLVIRDVNIVDVVKTNVIPHATVFIDSNRISKIAFGKTESLSAGAIVINGSNKYLIPGLWDMHTHNWNSEQFFPLLLANGVTGIRDMFDDFSDIVKWRKEMAEGKYDGPVIYAAGPIVDGPKPLWPGSVAVKNAEDGRRAVDSLKNKLGVDFIKVYSFLTRDGYFAIAEESKKQHIPFAGHVPNVVTIIEAAKAGQKSAEHLYGFTLLSSDSADYVLKVMLGEIKDSLVSDRFYRQRMLVRTFNEHKLEQTIKEFAKYSTWICPTMTVNRSFAMLNDSNFVKDDRLDYMGNLITQSWNPKNDFRFKNIPPDYYDVLKKDFAIKMKMIQLLHKAGVPLLAGTDYPNPYCFPGFSLHDELKLMTDAGLTPAQALQTATINPAKYFEITEDYGTVSAGKIANLVLLNDDPLKNIDNTRKINAVIVKGKLLDRNKLNELLTTAKEKAPK